MLRVYPDILKGTYIPPLREQPMDPHLQLCPNCSCLHRGKTGQRNLRVHSQKDRRCRCTTCGKTFAAPCNTPDYRLHKPLGLLRLVRTLLWHGCPRQAIVATYGRDERTVADGQQRAGRHSQRFQERHVQQGRVEVQHVQADEFGVKVLSRRRWMAMAWAVPSRLWLVEVSRRVARGSAEAIAAVLARTGTGTGINTASIERLNATFRSRWTPLLRRRRALVGERCVEAGMWLVGCASNFGWAQDSLRVAAAVGTAWRWQDRMAAMAADLTAQRWELPEVRGERMPPERWKAPRRKPRRWKRTTASVAPTLAA